MSSDVSNGVLLNRYILVLVQGVGNNDTNSVKTISIAKHKRAELPAITLDRCNISVPSVTIHGPLHK